MSILTLFQWNLADNLSLSNLYSTVTFTIEYDRVGLDIASLMCAELINQFLDCD